MPPAGWSCDLGCPSGYQVIQTVHCKEWGMDIILTEIECRVLGSLLEKELATPDYYPMTLNALTAACNQKSNRYPVMTLGEPDVRQALESLREKRLTIPASDSGRAQKYRHLLFEKLKLEPDEQAVVAELLLRGPQTVGELKGRSERMAVMGGLAQVESLLDELTERELVTKLPRQPGLKEQRYAHLFSGTPATSYDPFLESEQIQGTAEHERITALEEEVRQLREEVAGLRKIIEDFKRQFE